jgi:hypothetical protein
MPRLFFPNKDVLDDSAETSYFTGYEVAGADQGTSISIGYIGESYIDFGRIGMFVPIFMMGLFFGGVYRLFSRYKHRVMGLAVATSIILFGAYEIETSCAKLIGGNVIVILAMSVFLWAFGDSVWRIITKAARLKMIRPGKRPQSNG